MASHRRSLRFLLAALGAGLLAASAIACGASEEEKTDLIEGEPVELGELQYNVVFSRYLNPNDTQDRDYLVGQPPPPRDAAYFGVFLQIVNKSDSETEEIAEDFRILDTEERAYVPLPSESIFALGLGEEIGPEDVVPALDSAPQLGPIEASMVLFEIPDTASENRPLEFVIPGIDGPASIDLDI